MECNERVRRGLVANNSAAWNSCVKSNTSLNSALFNYGGACEGLNQEFAEARRMNPEAAAVLESMLGFSSC